MSLLFFIVPLVLAALCLLSLWWLRWRAFLSLVELSRAQNTRVIPPERLRAEVTTFTQEGYREAPRVSIVVASLNDGWWLERNLGYYLQQRYDNFEIVVADASDADDDTPNIVKRLQAEHPHLRYTRVPCTSRNIVLRKLALTLGIRAARSPWVVIVDPQAAPQSNEWLAHLSQHFDTDIDVVLGYANYDDALDSTGRRAVLQRAHRFAQQAQALFSGRAVGCDDSHVALRKSWFLANTGFIDSLRTPFGECTLLVDAHAEAGRVAVELHRDALLRLPLPAPDELREHYRQQQKLHRLLRGRCRWVFVRDGVASWAFHLLPALLSAFILLRVLYFFGGGWPALRQTGLHLSVDLPVYQWVDLAYDLPALCILGLYLWGSLRYAQQWLRALHEEDYRLYPFVYQWLQPWRASR